MRESSAYIADDDTPFFNKAECEAYEAHCAVENQVQEYANALQAAGVTPRTCSRRAAAVVAYLEWQRTGTVASEPEKSEKSVE